ncbi:unnamed protein product, partial [Prorocentrum cordatum]
MATPPWRAAPGGAAEPQWACVATRACGFRTNFGSRQTCWKCGRDRAGRTPPAEAPPGSDGGHPPRSTSARRRRRSGAPGDRAAGGPRPAGTATTAVDRARQGLKALQGLQYADDHPLIVAAKAELADLELAERQAQPPDVVLRELQAKLTDARERRAKSGTDLAEAEERVATLHKLQTTIDGEIEVLEQEAAQATRAMAAAAAGQVQNGQGIALLESINAQVQAMGMAFPAAQALQAAATGVAPDAAGQHAEERQLQLGRTQARCEQRGRRRAARKNVVLVTYNGSSWGTRRGFLEKCGPSVKAVAAQELRVDGDELRRAQGWAAREGWRAIITPCRRLESGRPPAGVGLFIRRHISVTAMPGTSVVPDSFGLLPSSAVACHADFGIRGGLVLVAAYFEVGNWAAGVNTARLFDIATALRGWNRPFTLAADFKCEPPALGVDGFLGYIPAATVARASGGTCRSAKGNYSNIDDWLSSLSLAGSLSQPRPVQGWPAAPHYPMQVPLDVRAKAVKFLVLSGPEALPKAAPDEDGIPVASVDHQDTSEADVARGGAVTAAQAQVRLDSLYATFMDAAEDELLA